MLKRSFGLCLVLTSQVALAQTPPAPKPAPPPAPAAPAAAAATTPVPGPVAAAATAAEPVLPQVSDDMLAPVPPATNVLANWRDALRILRENSTTLRTSRAREDVARAQSRQALAGSLPVVTAD